MISVFPQFIRPHHGPVWGQALAIGAVTVLTQLLVYGGLALAAGRSRDLLTSRPRATMLVGRVVGVLLIVVAVLAAWHGWAEATVSASFSSAAGAS